MDYTIKIQNAQPGQYVTTDDMDTFRQVIEYPITTAQGVFVNLLGGDQIGPLPLDTEIEIDANF